MTYKIGLVLDEERLKLIKGTELEKELKDLFGGALKMIDVEITEEQAKKLMHLFPRVRIDARGYVEETPIVFRRELFKAVLSKGTGKDAIDEILQSEKINEIVKLAKTEDEYLPPP
jgi:hypothetical protein